jgi:hypothetical protein
VTYKHDIVLNEGQDMKKKESIGNLLIVGNQGKRMLALTNRVNPQNHPKSS